MGGMGTGSPTPSPEESRCGDWQSRSATHQWCALCPLQWSQDGQSVLLDAELYEEEVRKNQELLPELAELCCATQLQAWLLANGFQLQGPK